MLNCFEVTTSTSRTRKMGCVLCHVLIDPSECDSGWSRRHADINVLLLLLRSCLGDINEQGLKHARENAILTILISLSG